MVKNKETGPGLLAQQVKQPAATPAPHMGTDWCSTAPLSTQRHTNRQGNKQNIAQGHGALPSM